MALLQNTYGKGRVRVLRLYRDGQYHEPRETSAKVLLEGDFSGSYTGPDNSTVIATDSIKNIVNVVGRENVRLSTEEYGVAIAKKFLDGYPRQDTRQQLGLFVVTFGPFGIGKESSDAACTFRPEIAHIVQPLLHLPGPFRRTA